MPGKSNYSFVVIVYAMLSVEVIWSIFVNEDLCFPMFVTFQMWKCELEAKYIEISGQALSDHIGTEWGRVLSSISDGFAFSKAVLRLMTWHDNIASYHRGLSFFVAQERNFSKLSCKNAFHE